VTAPGAILKQGTDTWRLANAGAVAVVWVIALRDAAPEAIAAAIETLANRGAEHVLIEGTTALDWMQPTASVMVATDPGRTWKDVARRRIAQCDLVLQNVLPAPCGDVPAPDVLADSHPIVCDLSDARDPGTMAYMRRLAALIEGRAGARVPAR